MAWSWIVRFVPDVVTKIEAVIVDWNEPVALESGPMTVELLIMALSVEL